MPGLQAWVFGHDIGLALAAADPEGPQIVSDGAVSDQAPAPGTKVARGSVVVVVVGDADGEDGGVREPLRPYPPTGYLAAEPTKP